MLRRPRIEGRDDPGRGMEKNAFRKMLEDFNKVHAALHTLSDRTDCVACIGRDGSDAE